MRISIFVIGALCVNFVVCESTYKAAVIPARERYSTHSSLIQEAAHLNADIFVLPSSIHMGDAFAKLDDDYDEVTRSISSSAKQAGVYVVAHVYEKTRCQNQEEVIRSNLVFDRQGSIIAAYRKPVNSHANCTTSTQVPVFTTDFGVTFGLLMEEDLVLQKPEDLKLKNFVIVGGVKSEVSFLSGSQFASSWAYVTNANVLTSSGVFAGKAGFKNGAGDVVVVTINKDGGIANTKCTAGLILNTPADDLSQYIVRPLDMQATVWGHTESVCHGKFCCQFYVKTSYVGSPQHEVSYGLAAFNDVRHFSGRHHIGAQSCSVVACAGLYKRSCALGPNNSTNTNFEKIIITGNFTSTNSAQFPLIVSTSDTQTINFKTENPKKVTITIEKGRNLLNFGIFGRVYSKDFESKFYKTHNENENCNYYDYFFNEDLQEFFDYIWIRLRILIFIVSIYLLEMM